MSMIKKDMTTTIVEPEEFDEDDAQKEEEYNPQHPALEFHAKLKSQTKEDHLDNYVEVKPFEK